MYKFITDLSPEKLDAFVEGHPACHLLQSAAWGKVKENWQPYYTGVEKDGKLVATALILSRPLIFGSYFWYIPRGPVMDYHDTELLKFYLKELVEYSKKHSCAFLRIDSGYERSVHYMGESESLFPINDQTILETFKEAKFTHKGFTMEMHDTIQPRFVASVYEEDIKKGYPKRIRRFLKESNKNYVEITKEGPEALPDFMFVLSCTEEEKDIKLRNQEYFERLFELYGDKVQFYMARLPLKKAVEAESEKLKKLEENLANLPDSAPRRKIQLEEQMSSVRRFLEFFKECQKEDDDEALLAGCFAINYGNNSEILYAGMNRTYSKITAQVPVFVETMNEAFSKGAEKVSMGGIPGTEDDGLSRFKGFFSPRVIEYLGEFDYVHRPLIYTAVEKMLPVYSKIRKKLSRHK